MSIIFFLKNTLQRRKTFLTLVSVMKHYNKTNKYILVVLLAIAAVINQSAVAQIRSFNESDRYKSRRISAPSPNSRLSFNSQKLTNSRLAIGTKTPTLAPGTRTPRINPRYKLPNPSVPTQPPRLLPPRPTPTPAPTPSPTPVPYDPLLPSSAKINITHQQQEHALCLPTSASMTLSKRGFNYPPRQIKLASLGEPWNGTSTPFNHWTPMSVRGLFDAFTYLKVSGFRSTFYHEVDLENGLRDIKRAIHLGYPVIILVTYPGNYGHAMAVSGYDDSRQHLIMNDPNLKDPGIAYYSYNSLKSLWSNVFSTRGAIFCNPDKAWSEAAFVRSSNEPEQLNIEY
jgi:hypothetical protein